MRFPVARSRRAPFVPVAVSAHERPRSRIRWRHRQARSKKACFDSIPGWFARTHLSCPKGAATSCSGGGPLNMNGTRAEGGLCCLSRNVRAPEQVAWRLAVFHRLLIRSRVTSGPPTEGAREVGSQPACSDRHRQPSRWSRSTLAYR